VTALVLRGNAIRLPLADNTVDLIVTSPPYFALRSYTDGGEHYAGQVGSEPTPAAFVDALVTATREMVRVLKPSGSIFVNLGDKYGRGTRATTTVQSNVRTGSVPSACIRTGHDKSLMGLPWRYALRCIDDLGLILRAEVVLDKKNGLPESVTDRVRRSHEQVFHFVKQPRYFSAVDEIREPHTYAANGATFGGKKAPAAGVLVGSGERTYGHNTYDALNPLGKLPGSVWEYVSAPFQAPAHIGVEHFAAFAPALPKRIISGWSPSGICTACGEGRRPVPTSVALDMSRSQARRAHELAEQAGLTEAHLAALLSVGVSDTGRGAATQNGTGKNTAEVYALADEARSALGGYSREYLLRRPTSFSYACACTPYTDRPGTGERHRNGGGNAGANVNAGTRLGDLGASRRVGPVREYHFDHWTPAPTTPAVVLDPFGGTGTTAMVARALGRTGISVDLSADYCRLGRWRTTDLAQMAKVRGEPFRKPQPQAAGQEHLFTPEVAG